MDLDKVNKWALYFGSHRNSFVSRDSHDTEAYDTEEQAKAAYAYHKQEIEAAGRLIWFAYIITPEGKTITLQRDTLQR